MVAVLFDSLIQRTFWPLHSRHSMDDAHPSLVLHQGITAWPRLTRFCLTARELMCLRSLGTNTPRGFGVVLPTYFTVCPHP